MIPLLVVAIVYFLIAVVIEIEAYAIAVSQEIEHPWLHAFFVGCLWLFLYCLCEIDNRVKRRRK